MKKIIPNVLSHLNSYLVRTGIKKLFIKLNPFKAKVKYTKPQEGYPAPYYNLVYRSMQELFLKNNQRFKTLEDSVIGGGWLLNNDTIAEETYRYLWYNLLFAIKNEKDDAVMTYWKNAFQFFQDSLRQIDEVRDTEVFLNILNKEDVDQRKIERKRFLEFHYALGGLLLYKKRYNCIKRIFEYTNSEPPRYVLFPINMSEIFQLYFYYKASWDRELTFISFRYPFPDMEGIRSDGKVRNWMCKYLSCLFVRQYTLHEYYIYQKHVEVPGLPEKLSEKVSWLNHLGVFKEYIDLILSDDILKNELGFQYINFEEIQREGKLLPEEIFENTRKKLEDEIAKSKKSQDLSVEKIKDFQIKSTEVIERLFQNLKSLFNENKIEVNFAVRQINGIVESFDRLAFCDDTDLSYMDVESILGTSYSIKWRHTFSTILYRMKSKTYVLKEENFFKGIDRLGLSKEEHIIISFGINMEFYKTYKKITGLDKDDFYNEIPMFSYGSFPPILSQSVLVLNRYDLPSVEFLDIKDEEKLKYGFERPIDEEFNIYADIIDLNINPLLIDEYENRFPNKDISKSVLAVIDLFTEIRWKKSAEVIHIQMDSEFEQRGLPNSLEDIKSIKPPKDAKSENN